MAGHWEPAGYRSAWGFANTKRDTSRRKPAAHSGPARFLIRNGVVLPPTGRKATATLCHALGIPVTLKRERKPVERNVAPHSQTPREPVDNAPRHNATARLDSIARAKGYASGNAMLRANRIRLARAGLLGFTR